jgi:subtilase family serine protease
MAVARITAAVDDRALTPLRGNVHPLARAQYDQGIVEDSLPLEHIILMLQRSQDEELALTTRIDQMHNRRSPYFHQWLRAEDVGTCYGVADSDIATVSGWLQSHGFQIDTVPAGKTMIIFSGTAGQVREAFHTEIHNLYVRGEQHIANMSEPKIPKALAPVIAGFRSLHNFFPKPLTHVAGPIQRDSKTGKWHLLNGSGTQLDKAPTALGGAAPQISYSDGIRAVGPQDLYTIYNENPLLTAATPINGAGQTLAIVQRSDVNPADVTSFRSQFGLPAYPSTPNDTQGGVNYMKGISGYCGDPGILTGAAETEADVDVEWIGVTAPAATIDLVSCADTATTIGVDLAAPYIVNHLGSTVSVFSESFGWCEANMAEVGFSAPSFYVTLWEQAVAEGQTPVVATSDTGDDTCDRGDQLGPNGQDIGETGVSVNGIASTPYNVAAGGTDFSDEYQTNFNPTAYWNSNDTTPYLSALSYIPETAWDNTCANTILVDWLRYAQSITYSNGPEGLCNDATHFKTPYPFTLLDGGSGGISTVSALPTWQSAYGVGLSTNYTSTSFRNLPDISLFASTGLAWGDMLVYCESDTGYPCDYSNETDAMAMAAGGTSFVAPMVAGVIGLINQAWPSGNPAQPTRQGQANYTFYALATGEYGTAGSENLSTSAPSVYTCEGSNINAISSYGSIFQSCTFHSINRTSQYGTSTCLAGNNAGCLASSNDQPCANGSVGCYTKTGSDLYGLLSNSVNTFQPVFPTSAGYNAATGLGSVNINNLVTKWTSVTKQFASTTTLAANPDSILTTASTTLTATVTATGRGSLAPPLGTVNFYPGSSCTGTALGSANLVPATACTTSCNSTASLSGITGAQLGAGTPSVVACFSGDGANDVPSTSPAVTVTVAVPPTFTVAGTTVSVNPGANTGNTSTITVTPSGGFTGSVTLTAAITSSPAGAQNPPTLSFGSTSPVNITSASAGTATLTISTTAPTTGALAYPTRPGVRWYAGGTTLAFGLLFGIGICIPSRRRSWRMRLGLLVLLVILAGGLFACGGSSSSVTGNPGTTPGTYTITVSGASGSITANGTVTLTVQ